jgi:tetratricopeptide (TPR) repeat protein
LEEYDLARQELERIVTLAPDYSNALWFLASAYEIQGNQQKAITSVEKVLQLNPGNEVVKDRLNRMRSGEITTLLPGDLRQPVEAGEEGIVEAPEGEVLEEGTEAGTAEEPVAEEVSAE